jgi:hypothetical protein
MRSLSGKNWNLPISDDFSILLAILVSKNRKYAANNRIIDLKKVLKLIFFILL